jgi:hypothetical protein
LSLSAAAFFFADLAALLVALSATACAFGSCDSLFMGEAELTVTGSHLAGDGGMTRFGHVLLLTEMVEYGQTVLGVYSTLQVDWSCDRYT